MKNLELLNEIKNYLNEKLNDYKNATSYGCDLAYLLTESENATGSVYCNAYKTKELIKANFELFGDFLEYCKDNFGTELNPFAEPEKAHVILLIESCSQILGQSKYLQDNWDNLIQLTDEVVEILKNDINNFLELSF
jgi:hypothetical protein